MYQALFISRRVAGRSLAVVIFAALLAAVIPCRLMASQASTSRRVFAGASLSEGRRNAALTHAHAAERARARSAYGELPLQFELNRGQADARFDFVSRGDGYNVLLSPTETILALGAGADATAAGVVNIKLVGANASAEPSGGGPLPGRVNYFVGRDSSKYRTNVEAYASVRYAEVYEGVDVVYYGRQRQLEYDFRVAPGADARRVALAFEGARSVRVEKQTGDLLLSVGGRTLRQHRPFAYQERDGVRHEVAARYVPRGRGTVGIGLGAYDHSEPLVIDPVLSYSSFVGGSGFDNGGGVAVDAAGNIYVTGQVGSADFPTTPGAYQKTLGSSSRADLFVMKLNPKATGAAGLVFSTFVGGSGGEHTLDLALDPQGNVVVVGGTDSTDFPVTANAFQLKSGGSDDGIIVKLSANGDALLYSTYVGGRSSDGCKGVALDAAGNIYAAGHAYSDNVPTTPGAFQTAFGGGSLGSGGNGDGDLFLVKVDPSASTGAGSLAYSTYFGGSGGEFGGFGIAVDPAGFVYVTGRTDSPNLPVTQGAFQTVKSGGNDLFITKLKPAGNGAGDLAYSTYFGGQGDDRGIGLALGADGSVYVTGYTASADFPVTKSALQSKPAGGQDAFVSKLNLNRSGAAALVYSTLLGGSALDVAWDVAVDRVGNAYLTGETRSTDLPITAGAFQSTIGGVSDAFSAPGGDAFAAKLNAAGTALVYFTYLGGSEGDAGQHVALDAQNNAYITGGYTFSANFPVTSGAFKTSAGGSSDAFVARIDNPTSFASGGDAGEASAASKASPVVNAAAFDTGLAPLQNPIDDAQKFVRQQYRDFLNREPDTSGLQFWTNEITSCPDAACREVKRVNVSAAFFLSIEFQQTGFLVYRLYRTSFARTPALREFSPDTVVIREGVIVNTEGWELRLAANQTAFIEAWVQRADFRAAYDGKSNAEYVDALFANAGVQPTGDERNALIEGLASGAETRATVLRKVAENSAFVRQESNKAFVLMQYFGYLQRNPEDPPDADATGYNYWLSKLEEFHGDYIAAEMVKAFISAGEYRKRFGQD